MTIAYTIGHEANYDKLLAESKASGRPLRKTGKGDQGRDPDYPGGWVFETIESAHAAALDAPMLLGSSAVFAMYAIELPGTWDECTYVFNGARHLLVDALIRCKVDEAWVFWQRFDVEVLALGGDVAQARAAAEQLLELTSATRASAKATVIDGLKRGIGRE
jgi:hypothetical protein